MLPGGIVARDYWPINNNYTFLCAFTAGMTMRTFRLHSNRNSCIWPRRVISHMDYQQWHYKFHTGRKYPAGTGLAPPTPI